MARVHFTFRKSYWKRKEKLEKAAAKAKAAAEAAALEAKRRKKYGPEPPHKRIKCFKEERVKELLDSIENVMTLTGEHLVFNAAGTSPQPATVNPVLNSAIERVRPNRGLDVTVMEISAEKYYGRFGDIRVGASEHVRYPVVFSFIAAALLPPHNGYAVVVNYVQSPSTPNFDIKYWAWIAIGNAAPELSDEYIDYLLSFLLIIKVSSSDQLQGLADKNWLFELIGEQAKKNGVEEARRVQTIAIMNAHEPIKYSDKGPHNEIHPIIVKLNAAACKVNASWLIIETPRRLIHDDDADVRMMVRDRIPDRDGGGLIDFTGWVQGQIQSIPTRPKIRFQGGIAPIGALYGLEFIPNFPHDMVYQEHNYREKNF